MTHSGRHPIIPLLPVAMLALLAGCENPVVTEPPTLTNDDIAEIVAATLGAQSGGMMVHMPDMVTAAHGGTILDRTSGGKAPSPQTDRSVRRSDTTSHDGESYGYDLDVLYSYKYSNSTFPQQDQFDPKLDFLILKGRVSDGTFVTPTLAGSQSASLSWYLRGLTLADPTYALDGTYLCHRGIRLLRKDLALSLDVGIALGQVITDPSTGELRTPNNVFATITIMNIRWEDGSPITGGSESLPLSYAGTLQLLDNDTAIFSFTDEYDKGHFYTIDTKVGRVR